MKVLLDTHTFLWFINDSPELSSTAANLLESDVDLVLSMASLWEIAIKVSLAKLNLPDKYDQFLPEQIALNNIEVLDITFDQRLYLRSLFISFLLCPCYGSSANSEARSQPSANRCSSLVS